MPTTRHIMARFLAIGPLNDSAIFSSIVSPSHPMAVPAKEGEAAITSSTTAQKNTNKTLRYEMLSFTIYISILSLFYDGGLVCAVDV